MKLKRSTTNRPDRKPRRTNLGEPGAATAKRVFIVEDHLILRATLVRMISGEKDLVLVDITLPGKSGLELVKELRAMDRKIKLLVVSMHDGALYADRALQAGANGYLRKRGKPEELIQAIRNVLDGRIYVRKDVRRAP
jgi:DNA-binding NarL/FixJ family response regulator